MINKITYKTKLSSIINENIIEDIINEFLNEIKINYNTDLDTKNKIFKRTEKIKQQLLENTKIQRKKELKILKEKIVERMLIIQKELKKLKNSRDHLKEKQDNAQELYENEQITKVKESEIKNLEAKSKEIDILILKIEEV